MNSENQSNEHKNQLEQSNENENLQADIEKMMNIPDVKPVKKGFAVTVISLFVALLVLPTLAWGALQLFAPATATRLNFDTGENRSMASFPEKFDPASFTSQVESWYNDHLPFRSVLYKTQENMIAALEQPYTETLRPALIKLFRGDEQIIPPSDDDPFPDLFGSETESGSETETLPDFIEDGTDQGNSDCAHSFAAESVVVTPATCTEYGVIGYPCDKCGYIGQKAYSKKADHAFVSNDPKLPTCGEKYEETLTCSVCDFSETKVVEKAHVMGQKLKPVKASTVSYGYTNARCKDCSSIYRIKDTITNKLPDTSFYPAMYYNAEAYEGRNRWLFYRGDNSEAYYSGANVPTDAELADYAYTFQTLNDLCEKNGIQLLIAVWPNKEQVYTENMPTVDIVNSYKRVPQILDYVKKNTDVNMIYPLAELKAAKPYVDVYFPYDTHWNNAGAFVGHQAMLKALGYETTQLYNCPIRELKSSDSDYGEFAYDYNSNLLYGPKADIAGMTGNPSRFTGNKNYIVTYRSDVKVNLTVKEDGKYNGVDDISHSTSNGPNDVNFVMLADSYRVMALDYLRRDFTDCFLCHRNKTMNADVVERIKKADVLVISAVERAETNILATAKNVIKILQSME